MYIDIEVLINYKISISQYLLACFILEENQETHLKYIKACGKFQEKDVKYLIDEGYLLYSGNGASYNLYELFPTQKLENLIQDMQEEEEAIPKPQKPEPTLDDFQTYSEKFRELFPRGIKPAGKPVKSSLRDIQKQLRKFEKQYPDYTREEVLNATAHYVYRYKMQGYAYMRTAYYFIHKQNEGSDLASEIDEIREKGMPEQIRMYGTEVK